MNGIITFALTIVVLIEGINGRACNDKCNIRNLHYTQQVKTKPDILQFGTKSNKAGSLSCNELRFSVNKINEKSLLDSTDVKFQFLRVVLNGIPKGDKFKAILPHFIGEGEKKGFDVSDNPGHKMSQESEGLTTVSGEYWLAKSRSIQQNIKSFILLKCFCPDTGEILVSFDESTMLSTSYDIVNCGPTPDTPDVAGIVNVETAKYIYRTAEVGRIEIVVRVIKKPNNGRLFIRVLGPNVRYFEDLRGIIYRHDTDSYEVGLKEFTFKTFTKEQNKQLRSSRQRTLERPRWFNTMFERIELRVVVFQCSAKQKCSYANPVKIEESLYG